MRNFLVGIAVGIVVMFSMLLTFEVGYHIVGGGLFGYLVGVGLAGGLAWLMYSMVSRAKDEARVVRQMKGEID
jgi:hypothetical protein